MRFLGILIRPVIALPFVLEGVDALANSDKHVHVARPLAQKLEEHGIPNISDADLAILTKASGAASVACAAGFAFGKHPFLAWAGLSAISIPLALAHNPIWEAQNTQERLDDAKGIAQSAAKIAGLTLAAFTARKLWRSKKKKSKKTAISSSRAAK